MNPLDTAIAAAIRKDGIREAEKITGLSYKEDPATDALGFFLVQQNAKDKEALLELNGDTMLCNKLDRYLSICEKIGFKPVFTLPFECRGKNEKQCFLYKPGVLLVFDTYWGQETVNSSHIYYNWTPNGGMAACYKNSPCVLSSGHWNKEGADGGVDIWSGDHDGREALKHKLMMLEKHGSFIVPWRYRPFTSLCHYGDYHDTKHIEEEKGWAARMAATDEITDRKILLLPKEIQSIIPERTK